MNTNSLMGRGRVPVLLMVVWFSLMLMLAGCKGKDTPDTVTPNPVIANPVVPKPDLMQIVATQSNFTLLNAAINRVSLGATLLEPGPFTVFAPTDDALRAAGYADVAAINAAPVPTLRTMLLYHVVSGTSLTPSTIPAANPAAQTAYPTLFSGNLPVFVTRTSSNSISVNNARAAQPELRASNGTIYSIDRVLTPPAERIWTIIQTDTSLSLLTAASRRAGVEIAGTLDEPRFVVTMFAPTNAAFRAAGYPDVATINQTPVLTWLQMLTNHMAFIDEDGRVIRLYSPTLGAAIKSLKGGRLTVTVDTSNTVTITSRGNNGVASRVTTPDINATNGVLHKIDRILLP